MPGPFGYAGPVSIMANSTAIDSVAQAQNLRVTLHSSFSHAPHPIHWQISLAATSK